MSEGPAPRGLATCSRARQLGGQWGLAIAFLLVFSAVPGFLLPAAATSWLATPRPLSDEELLELAVSADRSIGIVRVLGCKYDVEVDGFNADMLEVIPVRWYAGGTGPAPLHIYSDLRVPGGFSKVEKWGGESDSTAIVVALKHRDKWVVLQSPFAYGGGVSPATKANKALLETRMARVTARLSLRGMTQRSDLIVIGRPGPGSRECGSTRALICHEVEVDSVVRGVPTGDRVRFYDSARLEPDDGTSLLFLAATPTPGLYENVGFIRGRSPIVDGRVSAFGGQAIAKLVRKIRAEVVAPGPLEGN